MKVTANLPRRHWIEGDAAFTFEVDPSLSLIEIFILARTRAKELRFGERRFVLIFDGDDYEMNHVKKIGE